KREGRVAAACLVVVETRVGQGRGDGPLGNQGWLVVGDQRRGGGIGDGPVEGLEQPGRLAGLAEQQGARIGGQSAAEEVGDDGLGAEAGKGQGLAITVCHSGGLAARGKWSSQPHILTIVRPPRNYILRISYELSGLGHTGGSRTISPGLCRSRSRLLLPGPTPHQPVPAEDRTPFPQP